MSSLGQQLAPHLTLLRRFARALTGDQQQGDAYVRLTLESIVDAPDAFPSDVEPRAGLYRSFLKIWGRAETAAVRVAGDANSSEAIATARLAMIDKLSRQALLLSEVEGVESYTGKQDHILLNQTKFTSYK